MASIELFRGDTQEDLKTVNLNPEENKLLESVSDIALTSSDFDDDKNYKLIYKDGRIGNAGFQVKLVENIEGGESSKRTYYATLGDEVLSPQDAEKLYSKVSSVYQKVFSSSEDSSEEE